MPFSTQPENYDAIRTALCAAYTADESHCVQQLLSHICINEQQLSNIRQLAIDLVTQVRNANQSAGGITAFMQEYDLSSQEGVILLCLAEALLRIPDAETIDALIKDKLIKADWERHLGHSQSMLVNAGTWGLMLTGRIVKLEDTTRREPLSVFHNLVSRLGEPLVRTALKEAMRILGYQFVMGETIEAALSRSLSAENKHNLYSFDMLGEAALTTIDARRYFEAYSHAINTISAQVDLNAHLYDNASISIKLSALHPRFEHVKRRRVRDELIPNVLELARLAYRANIGLTIDGEEAERLDITLDVIEALLKDSTLKDWPGIGIVVQAYQKRAFFVLDWIEEQLRQTNRTVMVRLVKGAYWDTEIKKAQEQGLDGFAVFTRKSHTDVSYLACARRLLHLNNLIYPQFATHNAHTLAAILHLAEPGAKFEMQRLHGMGELLYQAADAKFENKLRCRVYAPVGSHKDLLPYLVRRLLENGANTSFVNRIGNENISLQDIVEHPMDRAKRSGITPHEAIVLPRNLYLPERENSRGLNLANQSELLQLSAALQPFKQCKWRATSVVNGQRCGGEFKHVYSPVNQHQLIGYVNFASKQHAGEAIDFAYLHRMMWDQTPVAQRGAYLLKTADLMQANAAEFIALLAREAGRCIADAIAEVREAVDFCRYYAAVAQEVMHESKILPGPTGERNSLSLHGRGIYICISPWNFPMAIFSGQIAAALVTGNCVIAKPAGYSPLIASRIVDSFHNAGIPHEVLQLIIGPSGELTNVLLEDERVAGVVFTGSTATAQNINRMLAARRGAIASLIAETGGQNAMIVDSTALPEQVVNDVMRSAYNSAGQRCSALRVLFLQDEIAERVIALLKGAMCELALGDPMLLSTDIGPVISRSAQHDIQKHIDMLSATARLIYQLPVRESLNDGCFIGPAVFEIDSMTSLQQEVFGPVVHVVRFKANALDKVIEAINHSGYGLTLGVHSRIESKTEYIRRKVRIGNVYVNRNMVGAVVGTQPFGGEGLSGTGPKAGGPHYLHRFVTERMFSVNTMAVGGNTSLMSLE